MPTTNDIHNLPSTKILMDVYNIDTSKFVLISTSSSRGGNTVVADYVYVDGDAEAPITLRIQANHTPAVQKGQARAWDENLSRQSPGTTNYSLRLSGFMDEVVDGVTVRVAPVSTVIAFTVPTRTIENLEDMARFISAAYFLLFPNSVASQVPTLAKLTRLSYGAPNLY